MPGKINLSALPDDSIITDRDNDDWVKSDGKWRYLMPGSVRGSYARSSAQMETSGFGPFTMAQKPPAPEPDLYQQARIALRDVLGMEPDEQMIQNTMQAHRPRITTLHETAASVVEVSKPMEQEQHQIAARHVDVSRVLDADFGVVVFVKDNDVAGLARLRAHAALDQLLDQHGISR